MMIEALGSHTASGGRRRDRLAAAFVLLIMGAGCFALWIGVPIGVLVLLSKATRSVTAHVVLGIVLVPAAMVAFSPVLVWLNWLYLRITGVIARIEYDARESGWTRRVGGPLEPMLIASLVIALAALAVWFFLWAENPSIQVL
jgi:hypothetical protein